MYCFTWWNLLAEQHAALNKRITSSHLGAAVSTRCFSIEVALKGALQLGAVRGRRTPTHVGCTLQVTAFSHRIRGVSLQPRVRHSSAKLLRDSAADRLLYRA
jgi:hypothetical protein